MTILHYYLVFSFLLLKLVLGRLKDAMFDGLHSLLAEGRWWVKSSLSSCKTVALAWSPQEEGIFP